jgi:hypothetical protein
MEIWKPVPQMPGREISNLGRLRDHKKYLKFSNNGNGYLRNTYKNRTYYAHRLVAEAFLPCSDLLLEVNHKDGNKFNNRADNLEWVSNKENMAHASKAGLLNRTFTNDQKEAIREAYKSGLTPTFLGRLLNVRRSTIGNIAREDKDV